MCVLAGTASRLRALLPAHPDTYAIETAVPDEGGWLALDALPVERWCEQARRRGNPRGLASVAAVTVGATLADVVLGRVTAALTLDGCAWDAAAGNLVVHRAAAGHVDRLALRDATAWYVAADPRPWWTGHPAHRAGHPPPSAADPPPPWTGHPARSAGHPAAPTADPPPPVAGGPVGDAVGRAFPDEAALLDAVAAAAVATLAPLLARVRAATRFGLVPLWNTAADTVRLTATFVPLYARRPPRPALAPALLDALVAHGALVRGRGVEQPLPGRDERVPVRAACCLRHRTDPPVARPSDAWCTTCPFLAPPARAARYRAFLAGISAAVR